MDKIYSTMRSLFRYTECLKLKCPDIITNLEKDILNSRLSQLNSDEILVLKENWNSYYEEQIVQSEIDNIQLFEQINRELLALN